MSVSFQPSVSGMQVSMQRFYNAAVNVSTASTKALNVDLEETSGTGANDITSDIVSMKIDKTGYSANAKAIKVQDRMLGELMDLVG